MFDALRRLLRRPASTAPTPSSGRRPQPEDSWAALLEATGPFVRTAWLPELKPGGAETGAARFGGLPWLAEGEEWPACTNCGEPMRFFLQLRLEDLPEPLPGGAETGLLQFFYCTNAEVQCDCDFADNGTMAAALARVVATDGPCRTDLGPQGEAYPPQAIIGWRAEEDRPGFEELGDLTDLDFDIDDDAQDTYCDRWPVTGDKLLGWPYWVQHVQYPECPVCGKPMALVFQIDSNCSLPYMFGDAGCGTLHRCLAHPEQLGFRWDCC